MVDRIDSHQHFWHYHPAKQTWMNKDMQAIKRDFLPQDLRPLLEYCQLNCSVAVQASQHEDENEFLLQLADSNPMIKGIVGWVDLRSKEIFDRLDYYKQFIKVKGFRHVIHDEPDLDFMLNPDFLNGIKALGKYGFTYDILIFHSHLKNTLAFVELFQDQPFVIDHIAKPEIRNCQYHDWKEQLADIAAMPNVYCKISGMVTEANWKGWMTNDFERYMSAVLELFGTDRIMYGSDWPVCTLSASYEEQYKLVEDFFSKLSQTERDDIFGLNAKRFYDLT